MEFKSPSTDTVAGAAEQLAGAPLQAGEVAAAAQLVVDLLRELTAMRRMDVGGDEPATVYDPAAQ